MRICQNCGFENNKTELLCSNCGVERTLLNEDEKKRLIEFKRIYSVWETEKLEKAVTSEMDNYNDTAIFLMKRELEIRGSQITCPFCGLKNPPNVVQCECGYSFKKNKEKEKPEVYLSGLGKRFFARFIDGLLLGFCSQISEAIAIILLIIQCYFLTVHGQSIGKKIVRIKIVDENTYRNAGFIRNVLIRELTFLIFGLFDNLYYLFSRKSQFLHDFFARTFVVETKCLHLSDLITSNSTKYLC